MIEPSQLRIHVIRPVLKDIGFWSAKAEDLVLGTAAQESGCGRYLVQLRDGPARGIYQMEPKTHADIYLNFLKFFPEIKKRVLRWSSSGMDAQEMVGNLFYATAMARLQYLRDPAPIPNTLLGQAEMWKRVYNTPLGAGTVSQYTFNWTKFVAGS